MRALRSSVVLLAPRLLLPAAAAAAQRRVPQGWLGVDRRRPDDRPDAPPATREWDLMAVERRRVRARRVLLAARRSATESAPPDLAALRRARARRRRSARLPVLPIVTGTPGLGGAEARRRDVAPARPGAVRRPPDARWWAATGRRGRCGRSIPRCAPLPIRGVADLERAEPDALLVAAQPFARSYVKLLRAGHDAR